MKFLNNWDLNRNQLLNAVVQNLATHPSNPVKGLVYFNTTVNTYYGWNGSDWVDLGSKGTGDMTKAVYDTDNDSIVDKAESIDDGTYSATAQSIKNAVDNTHNHTNKTLLDSYTQTEENLADAVTKKHEQNKDQYLDQDGANQVSAADAKDAVDKKHSHANKDLLDTYTQSEVNLADAVSKKHTQGTDQYLDYGGANEVSAIDAKDAVTKKHSQNTDTGTNSDTFQIGSGGPKVKNSSGEIQIRNATDDDFADLRIKNLFVEGTQTVINSNEVNIGDNVILLNADITSNAQNSDGGIAVKRLQTDDQTEGNAEVFFDETNNIWKIKDGAPEALQTFPIARKYVAVIGDGTTLNYTITHNLNSRDISVTIRETGSPYAQVITDVEFTTVNSITVKFAEAPTENQYTVTIVG
jgi:hypothetical protein